MERLPSSTSSANLSGAYLRHANLSNANLDGANLAGANFESAHLTGVNFKNSLFNSETKFPNGYNMNLEDAVFIEPKIMTSEDFLQTNLSGVDLKGLVLNGANLADVNLAGLDLSAANLSRTTLTNADLRGTNLSWTDLAGADLRGTNLQGTILRGANLDDGWYDSETVFPGGFDISSSNMNFLDSGKHVTNILSVDKACVAINTLDSAIDRVSLERSYLGSVQNKLQFTMSNLTSQTQNIGASRSSIQDTDFAADAIDLAKNQILAQSATAMLAQASAISQNILSLIAA